MTKIKFVAIGLLLSVCVSLAGQNAVNADTAVVKKSTVERVAAWYMNNINYGTITLLMTVESTFIPLPSEIVVPPAAYKASQTDSDLNIILVVVFAVLGSAIGATINYFLALWLGRPIIHKFADSKLGRMCLLNSEKVQKAEDYFVKHGKISTFIGRLVVGVRHLISIPAGLARMSFLPFITYTVIGAGVWNIILAVLGYLAHGQENFKNFIDGYSGEISYAMLALGVVFIGYLIYNGFKKKKK